MKTPLVPTVAAAALALLAGLAACEKQAGPAAPNGSTAAPADDHDHADHDHADHDHAPADDGHHGEPVALGETTAGPFTVKASRDEGEITAGGDAPIDVWVEPASPEAPKVAAVRFWIGAEDAAGSIKARAEIETPADPTRWHTHAEVPDPLPEGSKLWVEIEDAAGATTVTSFDLKQ